MALTLDVSSEEVKEACETSVRWLNKMIDQIKPYTIKQINQASKENGKYNFNVILVTECFRGKDFNFELTLDPSINTPLALIHHKQLN